MSPPRNNEAAQQKTAGAERLLLGDSQPMRDVEQEIMITARGDLTVLITGESGVGKELVAWAIHRNSKRATGPFITINCGALTESLLASELFGHVKGAFTGAGGTQSGLFEAANGGTIFLDEIGDMPLPMQVYLLRVLQERTILPVGSHTEKKVDVRVIAATNKDLEREAMEGRFRLDLFYRLNGFPIKVPALREHPSDIPELVRHFLGHIEIEEKGLALLCGHNWPGNVRELKMTIERLTLRATEGGVITTDLVRRDLRPREEITITATNADRPPQERPDAITYSGELRQGDSLDDHFQRQKLAIYEKLLEATGSHPKTAEWLRLNPRTLYNRVKRLQKAVDARPQPAGADRAEQTAETPSLKRIS